ncbi:MAG: alpha-L-arabinofuranosidase [Bacilli bacterium]
MVNKKQVTIILSSLVLFMPLAFATTSAHAAAASANVTVNASSSLGVIPQTAFGLNTGVYDPNLPDSSVPQLLQNADVGVLRFPGGSIADAYHWSANSITTGYANNPPDYFAVAPGNSFDSFMGLTQKIGAQAMITVNYGSNANGTGGGDPTEAANWVQYANETHNYNIKYWEIGNEVYGNGAYDPTAPYGQGGHWELDLHSQIGPQAYANNALTYISDMKAVDPNIDVGVVLTAPSNWPDGQTPAWNSTVLSTVGSKIDFVIVHWYPQQPGQETDAGLLASPETGLNSTDSIAQMMTALRSEISQYCGTNASHVQVFVTETNSVAFNPGKQSVSLVNALYLADDYMTWLENGASNVDWFALHNYISTAGNNSSSLYGTTNYGDYGLLSDGTSNNGVSEPSADTPFPPYYGYQMLSYLGKPGDTMVSASSTSSLITVHAVKQANGNMAVMILNKDPNNSYNVNVSLSGFVPAGNATVYTYGENSTGVALQQESGVASSFTQTVAPYSITDVVLAQAPSFSDSTAVANGGNTSPGQTTPITATFTDAGGSLANGILDIEVYDSAGQQVGQQYWTAQNLSSGQSATETYDWVAPGTTGAYTVKLGVFGPNWSPNYYWNDNAASVNSSSQSFTTATSVGIVGNASSGQTVPITTSFQETSGALANSILDIEVYNSSGQKVGQQYWSGENLGAGQTLTETYDWVAPAASGTYTVEVGVFGPNWTPNYYWNGSGGTVNVS